ncbi:MAG: hypothetical protein V7642_1004 [Burkholderiales bacterium]|jgi:hypothetical protein
MVAVNQEEVYSAYQFVSAAASMAEAFISLDTGKIYWVSDETRDLEEEEIPDDIETSDRYLAIPNQRDLDLGQRLIFRFIREQLPQHYDRVAGIFSRKGAYSRFKDFLRSEGALEKWYAYEEQAEGRALHEWCADHGIEVTGGKGDQAAR